MSYEVLEVVALPVREERVVHKMSDGTEIRDMVATGESHRKEPGETITKKEMEEAGQTASDIESLIDSGAIRNKDDS